MRAYLDHAATTPLRPEAREAWLAAADLVGNPASIHGGGQDARRLLEESRERLATVVDCDPIEIVFTSGGTESINLAVKGLWWADAARHASGTRRIVVPTAEHHATIDTVEWLAAAEGAELTWVPVDEVGRIRPDAWSEAVAGAALATFLAANNEVGTLQPVEALVESAALAEVPVHLDATSAFGHVPVGFRAVRAATGSRRAGLVAMSLSAHKIGGPVGVGALVVSRDATLQALQHGGGQQRGLRSGTQDVPGAAAFAVAAELAEAERETEAARLAALRDRLVRGIRDLVPGAELLGDPVDRLPGNAHILFPAAEGDALLFLMDRAGVAVSTGSACQAGVPEPSHVVRAMGRGDAAANRVLRLTLGRTSDDGEVDAFLAALPEAYARASASGPRSGART